MKIITKSDFLEIPVKQGVFAFLNGESCRLCERYMKEIANYKSSLFYDRIHILLLRDEHKHWMLIENQVLSTPCTRIYFDGMNIFQKGGILFDVQIQEFDAKIKEFGI